MEVSPVYQVPDAWAVAIPERASMWQHQAAILQLRHLARGIVPPGGVIVWPTNNPVPRGWAECNGQNGTVDLRGYTLVGDDVAGNIL